MNAAVAAAPRAGTRQRTREGRCTRGKEEEGSGPRPSPAAARQGPTATPAGAEDNGIGTDVGLEAVETGTGVAGQAAKPHQVSLSGEGTPAGPEMVEAEPPRRAAVVGWGPPSVGGGPWDPTTPLQPTPLKTRGTAQEFLEHAAGDSIALEPSESEAMSLWPQQGPLQREDNHPEGSGGPDVSRFVTRQQRVGRGHRERGAKWE